MASLAQRAAYAAEPQLIARVQQAVLLAAIDIAAEAIPDPITTTYTRRRQFVGAVLARPTTWAYAFAGGVVMNGNVGTGVSDPLTDDDALQYVVNSLWDAYSLTTLPAPVAAVAGAVDAATGAVDGITGGLM